MLQNPLLASLMLYENILALSIEVLRTGNILDGSYRWRRVTPARVVTKLSRFPVRFFPAEQCGASSSTWSSPCSRSPCPPERKKSGKDKRNNKGNVHSYGARPPRVSTVTCILSITPVCLTAATLHTPTMLPSTLFRRTKAQPLSEKTASLPSSSAASPALAASLSDVNPSPC